MRKSVALKTGSLAVLVTMHCCSDGRRRRRPSSPRPPVHHRRQQRIRFQLRVRILVRASRSAVRSGLTSTRAQSGLVTRNRSVNRDFL